MDLIVGIIALAGLLAALSHGGYLLMLQNAAKKRGASGAEVASYTRTRLPAAAGAGGVALLGFLIQTGGGVFTNVLGLLLAVGGGVVGYRAMQREHHRNPAR